MSRQSKVFAPDPTAALRIAVLLGALYFLWGSTYIGVRLVVDTIPAFLAVGIRFCLAGGVLVAGHLVWSHLRRSPNRTAVTGTHLRSAVVIGGLMLLGGNGLVAHAEETVDPGLAAVLVALVPIWMNVFESVRARQVPHLAAMAGLLAGLVGVAVLVAPIGGSSLADPLGAGLLALASISWAAGSLYSRAAPLPRSPVLASGLEMIAGGLLSLFASAITGELAHPGSLILSSVSVSALGYLIIFGSIIGFNVYLWLLRHAPIRVVSTYAYVNPVVAVVLGALLLHEPMPGRAIVASVLIVGAVLALVSRPPTSRRASDSPRYG